MATPTQQQDNGILLKSGTNEVEFIEFNIGDVSYGVNVAKVQRVLARPSVSITRVDNGGTAILGVIYVHEKPVTLIDLRTALQIGDKTKIPEDRQLILVTKFNRKVTAFLIDAVNKIHRTSWKEFEPIDDSLNGDDEASYVTGTIKIEGRVIVILDLEHLMLEFSADEHPVFEDPEKSAASPERKEKRQQVRIIYAEDSTIIRKMMIKTLQTGGYEQVSAFEHGKAAYEHIEQLREQAAAEGKSIRDYIDCIITDIEMPQMDGLTLCRSVKENSRDQHIPAVIVYSSLVNEEMARKCRSVGADAQISKPHGDEILRILDDFCLTQE